MVLWIAQLLMATGKVWPDYQGYHIRSVNGVTLIECPKPVHNRCVIELFESVVIVNRL